MKGSPSILPPPRALLAALAAALLIAPVLPSASGARTRALRTSAAQRFRQAEARFRSLTESPTARRRPELWDQAAARFSAIVSANPSGPWADDASYLLAEVYHERFHTLHREGDLDRAIGQYERLVDRYPKSPYADDALVQLGEIHYYQLGDPDQALRFYRRVLRDYPDGDMAARARARAGAIEGRARSRATVDAPEATIGQSPAPGRPLASPGAVIGGRTGVPVIGEGRQRPASRVRAERLPENLEPEEPGTPEVGERGEEATAPRSATPFPLDTGPGAPQPRSSRPLNPLLEEGPIPLRTPADNLPVLAPQGPRSQADVQPEVPSAARAAFLEDS